jgi:hypothetical protein
MIQSRRPLLSNVYNQNAYFSGNGVRTSLVAAVLKAFPTQRTYETIASIARQRLGEPLSATVNENIFYVITNKAKLFDKVLSLQSAKDSLKRMAE